MVQIHGTHEDGKTHHQYNKDKTMNNEEIINSAREELKKNSDEKRKLSRDTEIQLASIVQNVSYSESEYASIKEIMISSVYDWACKYAYEKYEYIIKHGKTWITLDDCRQAALLGCLQALKNYTGETSYAYYCSYYMRRNISRVDTHEIPEYVRMRDGIHADDKWISNPVQLRYDGKGNIVGDRADKSANPEDIHTGSYGACAEYVSHMSKKMQCVYLTILGEMRRGECMHEFHMSMSEYKLARAMLIRELISIIND